MPRGRNRPNREREDFKKYLEHEETSQLLEMCKDDTTLKEAILDKAPLYGQYTGAGDWTAFVQQALSLYEPGHAMYTRFASLNHEIQQSRAAMTASHQERHRIVNAFGLQQSPASISGLLSTADSFGAAAKLVYDTYGLDLILRERKVTRSQQKDYPNAAIHPFRRYIPLVEHDSQDASAQSISCTENTGFFILPPDKSAVFVSVDADNNYTVEMIVLRNIPTNTAVSAEYIHLLLQWLQQIITTACTTRRNQRPTHSGNMVQIGLNMGARHARILGWAKSFSANLSMEEKIMQDSDLIGAMSLFWALIKAFIPVDITDEVQGLLYTFYPRLATSNVSPGCGFTIKIGETDYEFKTASRAPPEGYVTLGYVAPSHIDQCFTRWAFNWTVGRIFTCPRNVNDHTGGAFVDLGIKVVVQASESTLTGFQPAHMHGTTDTTGVQNYSLSITSTRHVAVAIQDLIENGESVFDWQEVGTCNTL